MKETPILYSTEMVKAILDGSKTETRRTRGLELINLNPDKWSISEIKDIGKCPYGQQGDVLWVREMFSQKEERIIYRAQVCSKHDLPDGFKWKPSIHMPKAAARIWLQVEEIKAERLQDITSVDAEKEGAVGITKTIAPYAWNDSPTPKQEFIRLWKSINGEDSWEKNPFVWVIKFKLLSTTGKPDFNHAA